jgi:hypothetical protein
MNWPSRQNSDWPKRKGYYNQSGVFPQKNGDPYKLNYSK